MHFSKIVIPALLATTALATPAMAQTAKEEQTQPSSDANDGDGNVTDIVVTAQRRSESLSHVGIAVTALGADDLIREGVRSPQDLVHQIPGLQATSSQGGAPVYSLRGIGFVTRNVSTTAPIGMYLDQATLPYPYMAQGVVFDLERVEALKGPQGTLYGRNATGGLINYVTRKPTATPEAGLTLDVGNYETLNVSGYLSGPLSDTVRVRLAVDSQDRNRGWQKSVTRDDRLGVLHQKSLRGTIDFGNGGPFTGSLSATAWWRHGDTLAPQAISYVYAGLVGDPRVIASIIPNPTRGDQADWLPLSNQPQSDIGIYHPAPLTDSNFFSATLNLAYELSSSVKLVSLSTYDHLNHRDVSDANGTQAEGIFNDTTGHVRSVSQELRLVGEGDRLTWSLGGYVSDDHARQDDIGYNDQNGQIELLRGFALSVPQTRYTAQQLARSFGNYTDFGVIDSNVYAAFANFEYKLSALFKINLGGRYTKDKIRYTGCTADYKGTNVALVNTAYELFTGNHFDLQPGACYLLNANLNGFTQARSEQNAHNFSWNATATFTPNNSTLFYGSIARGYKAGAFPILPASVVTQLDPVEQEQLTAYELGTKLTLFDRKVQFNADAFYYDYRNKQVMGAVADLIFGTLTRIRNVPKSRVYGFEGDLNWRITRELTLSLAAAYINSKITSSFNDFSETGVPGDFKGRPFAYTPNYQGAATLAYDRPISDKLRFLASGTLTFQGNSHADLAGDKMFDINGYALVNATIGLSSSDGWELTAYGRNIFNKYYWTGVASEIDTVARYPGMPAEYGIRASIKF